jgi:hypothetical protein
VTGVLHEALAFAVPSALKLDRSVIIARILARKRAIDTGDAH